jgi:hypothetical protein
MAVLPWCSREPGSFAKDAGSRLGSRRRATVSSGVRHPTVTAGSERHHYRAASRVPNTIARIGMRHNDRYDKSFRLTDRTFSVRRVEEIVPGNQAETPVPRPQRRNASSFRKQRPADFDRIGGIANIAIRLAPRFRRAIRVAGLQRPKNNAPERKPCRSPPRNNTLRCSTPPSKGITPFRPSIALRSFPSTPRSKRSAT